MRRIYEFPISASPAAWANVYLKWSRSHFEFERRKLHFIANLTVILNNAYKKSIIVYINPHTSTMPAANQNTSESFETIFGMSDPLTDVIDDLEFDEITDDEMQEQQTPEDQFIEMSTETHETVIAAENGVRMLLEGGPEITMEDRVPVFRDVLIALVVLGRTETAAGLVRALTLLQPILVQRGTSLVPSDTMEQIQATMSNA